MATLAVQFCRSDASSVLGEKLGDRFHGLFDHVSQEHSSKKKDKKKQRKKSKGRGKDKKQKRDKSPEKQDLQAPSVELHGNASSFMVYTAIRQAVLEHNTRHASQAYMQALNAKHNDSDTEDEIDDKTKDLILKMPKVVGLGLVGVFELIRETKTSHPGLCVRALQALLDMLQGQQPEGLKAEPGEVIDSLYQLLMDICTTSIPTSSDDKQQLMALACSCLLSLVISRGDTGKLLSAVAATLMSPATISLQDIKVPGILTSLQKSVHAVLLGRTQPPDWLSQGIKESSRTENIPLDGPKPKRAQTSAIASDGRYLYIHNDQGLHKAGSGYGGTIKGHVYLNRRDFHPGEHGWLAFAQGKLFYKNLHDSDEKLTLVNTDTLEEQPAYLLEGDSCVYGPNVMFSDGENLGHVAAAKDDSFVVRTFNPQFNPMPLVNEIQLKLARKCVDVFGTAAFDPDVEIHTIGTGFDEDSVSIAAGKDFALIRTLGGKILYTGKSQSLGIKQGGPAQGKWAELPITKSPKIVQYAVGHEGQHALLVADDGSLFFVGTPKRGEDGDSSLSKGRRQPKPVKPKKMIKLDSKNVAYCACNSGSSAVVTKEGEVYMFGKDTQHCDHASGHVPDLKDVTVTSIALGKAHVVALSNKGHVYTFGLNNKGQCGREYVAGGLKEISTTVTMADEEEEPEDDFMCAAGLNLNTPTCKHKWKADQCMVCTNCGECTGYGGSCISSGRPDRNPGLPCGCGAGDSGCQECGVCRSCAGELQDIDKMADGPDGYLEMLARSKDVIPLDLIIGRHGARNLDQLSKRFDDRRQKSKLIKNKAKSSSAEGPGSDFDPDHTKVASLAPSRLDIGNSDIPVMQLACGLQHTVVLLENGDVYTWGGNTHGQLGLGDTNVRGTPTKVAVKSSIVQVAAGSSHTIMLTASGQVYTFGSYQKGQLGRPAPEEDKIKKKKVPTATLR